MAKCTKQMDPFILASSKMEWQVEEECSFCQMEATIKVIWKTIQHNLQRDTIKVKI